MKQTSPTTISIVLISFFGMLALLAKKSFASIPGKDEKPSELLGAPKEVTRWTGIMKDEIAGISNGLNPNLMLAIVWQESLGNPSVVGGAGEIGLMQVKPSTAAQFGIGNPDDLFEPGVNIRAGVRFFAWLSEQTAADQSVCFTLRAYNAGLTGASANPNAGLAYANAVMNRFLSTNNAVWC